MHNISKITHYSTDLRDQMRFLDTSFLSFIKNIGKN